MDSWQTECHQNDDDYIMAFIVVIIYVLLLEQLWLTSILRFKYAKATAHKYVLAESHYQQKFLVKMGVITTTRAIDRYEVIRRVCVWGIVPCNNVGIINRIVITGKKVRGQWLSRCVEYDPFNTSAKQDDEY